MCEKINVFLKCVIIISEISIQLSFHLNCSYKVFLVLKITKLVSEDVSNLPPCI